MAERRAAPLVPPAPRPAEGDLPLHRLFAAFQRDMLPTWPARAYEDDVLVSSSLGRRWILLNAPAAIHRVLVDNPEGYGRTPATIRILRPFTGQGLLLSQGQTWKHQRRTLAPAFAPRALDFLPRIVMAASDEAMAALGENDGGPVDLLAVMQHLALEIAGRSMFSLEMARYRTVMRDMIGDYGRRLGPPGPLDFLLPVWLPSLRDLPRFAFQRRWFRVIESVIDARSRLEPPEQARDLFDLLLAARDPETGRGFTPHELRDQVATLIVAGHETTALTLFWAVYLLALDHGSQERLAAEVLGADLSAEAAARTLDDLVFTKAVVQEALRLYPPAFTLVRLAKRPDRVDNLDIAPGDVIMIAPWVLHRHRRLWQAPEVFDPTRFLPAAPPPERFAYLPFGAGPRVCIGAQFALTEATLVLARLVQRYHIALEDDEPVMPVAVVTTQPSRAPAFRLSPRRDKGPAQA